MVAQNKCYEQLYTMKKHMSKTRVFFCIPLLESLDLGLGLRYQERVHMEFFDLESLLYGFAGICSYMFQTSKLRK